MSPEQARGQAVDKRTDIWAFGCVLYEMLTGRSAFAGNTISDTIAAILDREPDLAALPKKTPAPIAKLLQRCLEKDPKRRVPDIAVARFELDEALTGPAAATVLPPVRPLRMWQRPVPLVAGIVVLLGVTLFGFWALTRPSPRRVVRLTVTLSGATALDFGGSGPIPNLAISPDGTRLAYAGAGAQGIVVRALDELQPTTLRSLGAPAGLFFSPDGQWIGFFDADGPGTLKKIAATGGPPVTVSRFNGPSNPRGASWSTDDSIIFATENTILGLLRVSAAGGEPEVLTTPNRDQGELAHWWPEVLPGGKAVLFTITTAGGEQIAVLDLTTRQQKILIRSGIHARYVPTGHLVYSVDGALWAVAFDLRRLEVVGTPVPVLEQVMTSPLGAAYMSLSDDGTLVYVPGGVLGLPRTVVWVDRQGREEPLKTPPRAYWYPRLSPDGTRVALDVRDQESDIWIWDLAREKLTRFTFDPQQDTHPAWTPDGLRVLFRSARSGQGNLFWQAADGTGAVERLTESANEQFPGAFSPDGTRLVFREETKTTGEDLMVLVLEGDRRGQPPPQGLGQPGRTSASEARPLVRTTFSELNGEISPDGRWLVYQSNESGQHEIYVRPFPDIARGRWQISTGGGTRPLWARSGKELFYLGPSGAVMSTSVEDGSGFRAGNPTRLFEGPYFAALNAAGRTYDVSLDGQRFLMIKEGASTDATSAPRGIVVVQNWTEELKRLIAAK
jgi:serine/threonine-protein kinase